MISQELQTRLLRRLTSSFVNKHRENADDRTFDLSVQWLNLLTLTKHPNSRCGTTGYLKHRAEKFFGDYIPQPSLVLAAAFLGIPIKVCDGSYYIGVTKKSIEQVSKDQR